MREPAGLVAAKIGDTVSDSARAKTKRGPTTDLRPAERHRQIETKRRSPEGVKRSKLEECDLGGEQ